MAKAVQHDSPPVGNLLTLPAPGSPGCGVFEVKVLANISKQMGNFQ